MSNFETPSWDGEKETEQWASDFFKTSKVTNVHKNRKRNKYPKGFMKGINSSQASKKRKDVSTMPGNQVKTENPDKLEMVNSTPPKKKRKKKTLNNFEDNGVHESTSPKISKDRKISFVEEDVTVAADKEQKTSPTLNPKKKKKKKSISAKNMEHNNETSDLRTVQNKLDIHLKNENISQGVDLDIPGQIPTDEISKEKKKKKKRKKKKKATKDTEELTDQNESIEENCLQSSSGPVEVSKKRKHPDDDITLKKKQKKKKKNEIKRGKQDAENSDAENDETETSSPEKKRKSERKQGAGNQEQVGIGEHDSNENTSKGRKKKKLSLREKMEDKLRGARFRFLNEQLYTSKSKDTNKFFLLDQKAFEAYHDGYKQQLEQWPVKPIDLIIKSLKRKPLSYIIADFGCGDALLTQSLPNKVFSFDHVALNNHVTVCDMAHTPLTKGSVDVVVFCLSLMGSNLSDYIYEANRVLKIGGVLKIAEVESRFDKVEKFIQIICKFGFLCIRKDLKNTFFYLFDFRKEKNLKEGKALPSIELRACYYKKR